MSEELLTAFTWLIPAGPLLVFFATYLVWRYHRLHI